MSARDFAIRRRAALKALSVGAAASAMTLPAQGANGGTLFKHGVASGDPLQDRVILWTRVSPLSPKRPQTIAVDWIVKDLVGNVAARGQKQTDAGYDFTVKVDAGDLKPGTRYTYQFSVGDETSPVGKTQTLPSGEVSAITLAACSCSNYPYGFFNVYKEMARNAEIDFVLHLGDYIYEYALNTYSSKEIEAAGRTVLPEREIVSLDDYRQRYARYRTDPDLQAVHAAHPFLMIWDDHEISNDAWSGGAENHQSEKEGPWAARRDAALQAYEEWTPTRANMQAPWRRFDFGNLARLMLLDTRLWGRDQQLSYARDFDLQSVLFDVSDPDAPLLITSEDHEARAAKTQRLLRLFDMRPQTPLPVTDYNTLAAYDAKTAPPYLRPLPDIDGFKDRLNDPKRSLLGDIQQDWLEEEIEGSRKKGQVWQILGQQVLMGRVPIPDNVEIFVAGQTGYIADRVRALAQLSGYGLPLNTDAWDGYPAARERVLSHAQENAKNLIVLAGDTHNAWVSELTLPTTGGDAPIGYEFATASVSSPGFDGYFPAETDVIEKAFLESSPTLKWLDAKHRGFLTLRITPDKADVSFHRISTVKSRSYETLKAQTFSLSAAEKPGKSKLSRSM